MERGLLENGVGRENEDLRGIRITETQTTPGTSGTPGQWKKNTNHISNIQSSTIDKGRSVGQSREDRGHRHVSGRNHKPRNKTNVNQIVGKGESHQNRTMVIGNTQSRWEDKTNSNQTELAYTVRPTRTPPPAITPLLTNPCATGLEKNLSHFFFLEFS